MDDHGTPLFGGKGLPLQLSPREQQRRHMQALRRRTAADRAAAAIKPSERFKGILRERSTVPTHDTRSNLQRYLDYLQACVKRRHDSTAKTIRHLHMVHALHLQLAAQAETLAHRINRGYDDALALATYEENRTRTREAMHGAITEALRNLRYARHRAAMREQEALLLEVPYLLLRGNKKTLIELTRRGIYDRWSVRYPFFWLIADGPGYYGDDDHDEDDGDLPAATYHPGARRPIWWELAQPGNLTRVIRELVPRTKKEKEKIFHSPAFLFWHTQRHKRKSTPLEDFSHGLGG